MPGPRESTVEIRKASIGDAPVLSALALEAKAQWGYTTQLIEAWRDSLQVSASDVAARPVFVAAVEDRIVGFSSLMPLAAAWELDNLFVAPAMMNRGTGRALLEHALDFAFARGAPEVTVDADPNAERFYLACGARRLGEVAAPIPGRPDRVRPQLAFSRPATR